jgi:hypothetical protein
MRARGFNDKRWGSVGWGGIAVVSVNMLGLNKAVSPFSLLSCPD